MTRPGRHACRGGLLRVVNLSQSRPTCRPDLANDHLIRSPNAPTHMAGITGGCGWDKRRIGHRRNLCVAVRGSFRGSTIMAVYCGYDTMTPGLVARTDLGRCGPPEG